MALLALLQSLPVSDECLTLGFCPAPAPLPPVAPGVMFLAIGLVFFGLAGLRRGKWLTDQ